MAQVNTIYLQDPVPHTEPTARSQSTGNDLQKSLILQLEREIPSLLGEKLIVSPGIPPTPSEASLDFSLCNQSSPKGNVSVNTGEE